MKGMYRIHLHLEGFFFLEGLFSKNVEGSKTTEVRTTLHCCASATQTAQTRKQLQASRTTSQKRQDKE
jgi:hypothetical protein